MSSLTTSTLPELRLTLAPTAPLEAAGAAARACAVSNGINGEQATRMQILVEELIREARLREVVNGQHDVTVDIDFAGDRFRVSVSDQRLPLRSTDARHLRSRRLVALGFVDRLHVGFAGTSGNLATAELVVPHPHGQPAIATEATTQIQIATAPEADEPSIRLMTADDAIELVRCVYRCYGYSYPNPALYQAKAIRRLLESGTMVSVVAVSGNGEIVGHVAYTFDRIGDRVPEAGKMIVDPRYRGHHLAERLASLRLSEAQQRGIVGLWAECVTNHSASQRVAIDHGGLEVGLQIGAIPAFTQMVGLPAHADERQSFMTMFMKTRTIGTRTLSIPSHLIDHVTELAQRAEIPRSFEPAVNVPDLEHSRVITSAMPSYGIVTIRLEHLGRDLCEHIAETLESFQHELLGTVYVELPASHPASAWAITQLENIGFAWSGWIPEFLPGDDVLRLQRVTHLTVHDASIHCARAEGEAVRAFVLEQWHRIRKRSHVL